MTEESTNSKDKRICYACDSDITYTESDGHQHWYGNPPTPFWLCEKCNNKYIKNPKWHPVTNPVYHSRQLNFKGRLKTLAKPPRIGVCNWCRRVVPFDCKRTEIHHETYHEDNLLQDTIELCTACHNDTKQFS